MKTVCLKFFSILIIDVRFCLVLLFDVEFKKIRPFCKFAVSQLVTLFCCSALVVVIGSDDGNDDDKKEVYKSLFFSLRLA